MYALGVGSRVGIHEIERVFDCQMMEAKKLLDGVVGSPLVEKKFSCRVLMP